MAIQVQLGILAWAAALGRVVLDGELCAYRSEGRLDFAALGYGPARRRAEGIAVVFVAFDLLGARGRDLRLWPLSRRRERLAAVIGAGNVGVQLMISTLDVTQGRTWISGEQAAVGIEGAVAKPLASRYPIRGGRVGWVKVRFHEDVDVLVLGVTGSPDRPTALVLGQADPRGRVRALLPGAAYTFALERVAGSYGISFSDRLVRFLAASAVMHAVLAAGEYLLYRYLIVEHRLQNSQAGTYGCARFSRQLPARGSRPDPSFDGTPAGVLHCLRLKIFVLVVS
ncbi:hypothetical protein QRX50_35920 [Amycolatopsis carbonis]|uniref:ATP-dependent DNA ligase family profile domain-containing protein n=1 Tax=Amycolatopsis carbonis TaxID=715471 RepID=A0A9Y2ICX4_9PSEU|nr:hypothetical protein [Amycolatopsis sp. 2-15]WIX76785.1 hypothetical protein QRX50_35920 [Amycolatopsis sp. 2-15]